MKYKTLKNIRTILLILFIYPVFSFAQTDSIWYRFHEGDYMGYKNSKGEIMIEPKFYGFTKAHKFDKIMGALEVTDTGEWLQYYLLKNGTKIFTDSMYIEDFSFACESEGYIKFRDPKTELVGLLNQYGKVVIPADYIDVSDVKNGLFSGYKGAQKKYWDTVPHAGCDHFSWVGGTIYLMDVKNTVLIDNFNTDYDLNYYSLKVSKSENKEIGRRNFIGTDGNYYSFLDNKILLDTFINTLLKKHSKKNIMAICYDSIAFADQNTNTFTIYSKNEFITEKYQLLQDRLDTFNINKIKFESTLEYDTYYNNVRHISIDITDNCGDINSSKYPLYKLTFPRIEINDSYFRETLSFIYLNNQYVLIDAVLLSP